MTSGTYAGQTLSLDEFKSDFAHQQVAAWVGIESSATQDYGYVTSVNGHRVDAILALTPNPGNGTITASDIGFLPMR